MRLDLHTHSKYSDDSNIEPSEIVRIARERGMDGVAVTDHLSLQGGLEARSANRDPAFLVIPGIEYPTEIGHVVGLFLEREPDLGPGCVDPRGRRLYSAAGVVSGIHAVGGLAVLAHPFQARVRLPGNLFRDTGLDALEGFNGRADTLRNPSANKAAQDYARTWGLPVVGGSDAHFEWEIAGAGCLIQELEAGASLEEVRLSILRGLAVPFGTSPPRTAHPLTGLVKIGKTGRYGEIPKTLLRLALAALGPTGLKLENLILGPLDRQGGTHTGDSHGCP